MSDARGVAMTPPTGDADRRHIGARGRPGVGWLGLQRALRLRCPRCGIGRVTRSWFALREAYVECGLLRALRRGGLLARRLYAELHRHRSRLRLILAAVLNATWPQPPWM